LPPGADFLKVHNSVIRNNRCPEGGCTDILEQQISIGASGTPVVKHSCIEDGSAGASPFPFGGSANFNIDTDPMFRDSAVAAGAVPHSPCVDAGADGSTASDMYDADEDMNTTESAPELDGKSRIIDLITVGDPNGAGSFYMRTTPDQRRSTLPSSFGGACSR